MNAKKKLTTGVGGTGNLKVFILSALMMFACSKSPLPMNASSVEGDLVITVNQDSALVIIKDENHRIIAQTQNRYASYRFPSGEYNVTGTKAGYQPAEQVAFVIAGQETVVNLDLLAEQAEPPNLTFSVAQDSVEYGEAVMIEWQSNGFQVVIDQGVGIRGPAGSEEVNFVNPGKKTFTATAYADRNVLTIKRDSTYVKETPLPLLPVLMLSTTSLVTVDTPARIIWLSQNADYVVVDFVENAALQGNEEVAFSTAGVRIVTATAFNQAGYLSVTDTIQVVEPEVTSVDDIIISTETGVRADKGESGWVHKDAAVFDVAVAGNYQVLAEVWYNSGDSQKNESFYLALRNDTGNTLLPQNPNAGIHKVVPDDPGAPHAISRESGVFSLSEGRHAIDLFHYAKIATHYPNFLNGPLDGPESVKILGFRLVYLGN